MPVNKDVWWDLHEAADAKDVASEVVAAIGAYAVPAIREQV
jgi:predicted DNA-binding protein with PD1-like motif